VKVSARRSSPPSAPTPSCSSSAEVCAGGFLIFDPDYQPVVWSQAERAKGQAWGMQTVASFHIKGTPPVPEEEVLLARSAGH